MVETHCHLVPGVDDGAVSLEISLAMIEEAKQCGITAILTTPHIRGELEELPRHSMHRRKFATVLEAATDMELILGGEVRATPDTMDVAHVPEYTVGEAGKYLLLEFEFERIPDYAMDLVTLYRSHGITPVIAHPERNIGILAEPTLALDLVLRGALLQVTTGSLIGELGETREQAAVMLVESGIVSILASDAHNVTTRRFTSWPAAYERAAELESRHIDGLPRFTADELSTTNPLAMLRGTPIAAPELDALTVQRLRDRLSGATPPPAPTRKRLFFP